MISESQSSDLCSSNRYDSAVFFFSFWNGSLRLMLLKMLFQHVGFLNILFQHVSLPPTLYVSLVTFVFICLTFTIFLTYFKSQFFQASFVNECTVKIYNSEKDMKISDAFRIIRRLRKIWRSYHSEIYQHEEI